MGSMNFRDAYEFDPETYEADGGKACYTGPCNSRASSRTVSISVQRETARQNLIPTVTALRKVACSAGCMRYGRSRTDISRGAAFKRRSCSRTQISACLLRR